MLVLLAQLFPCALGGSDTSRSRLDSVKYGFGREDIAIITSRIGCEVGELVH